MADSGLQRIFYATHNVMLGGKSLKGVQSVSLSSNFNLEPVFQLGQLSYLEQIPTTPTVEVTINRSIVGGPAIKLDINDNNVNEVEKQLQTAQDIIIGSDAGGFTIKNGFLSSYRVNFATEGVFNEEITYVGDALQSGGAFSALSDKNVHLPRRQDFTGIDNAVTASISVDFRRESIYRLGQYKPFLRTVTFPIECSIQYGVLLPAGGAFTNVEPGNCSVYSTEERSFSIGACSNVWTINKARLSSVNYSGGDTGGGNVTIQYTYTAYNNIKLGWFFKLAKPKNL